MTTEHLTNKEVLEVLQNASDAYVNFVNAMENLSNPSENKSPKWQNSKVEIGDVFAFPTRDKNGVFTVYYVKLTSYNDKLYFIDCNEDGSVDKDVDYNECNELNKYTKGDLDVYLHGAIHCKAKK